MNIVMTTNTFTPHLGGVARSVQTFTGELRRRGHRVLVIAPAFEGMPEAEEDVIRLPAWRHFTEGDFSVPAPLPGRVTRALNAFGPEIVHAHHPFLLGETALRVGASRNLPVVFTHHTLYEHYTHYLPGDSPRLRRFAIDLATGFGNLCDAVIAPSRSVAELIEERGVTTPIDVIPTGVDVDLFSPGDGDRLRDRLGIPHEAFVIGHVGRLAPEKATLFLAAAVARFLSSEPTCHFLLVGAGPSEEEMEAVFARQGLSRQLHRMHVLTGMELVEAYRAMDGFVFASQSETQGMVLTEAMATGAPVIAVDGPGVREVVRDGFNGRILERADEEIFAEAIGWLAGLDGEKARTLRTNALRTAEECSLRRSADKLLSLYQRLKMQHPGEKNLEASRWASSRRFFQKEFRILRNLAHAAEEALRFRETDER
jgi:glycosyltransferase involved in cell wall biosynthesis